MFFNLKKSYLFLGCIVFFINNFTSDTSRVMSLGLVNYQELNAALEMFADKIDQKLARQFATKEDMESCNRRLDGILSRLG